jgi:hypothetical protein
MNLIMWKGISYSFDIITLMNSSGEW